MLCTYHRHHGTGRLYYFLIALELEIPNIIAIFIIIKMAIKQKDRVFVQIILGIKEFYALFSMHINEVGQIRFNMEVRNSKSQHNII